VVSQHSALLVAYDDEVMRYTVKRLRYDVIGQAVNGQAAVDLAENFGPT
jgi:hypothetical protein